MASGKLTVGTCNATKAINLGLYSESFYPSDATPGSLIYDPVKQRLFAYLPAANNTFAWAEVKPA